MSEVQEIIEEKGKSGKKRARKIVLIQQSGRQDTKVFLTNKLL